MTYAADGKPTETVAQTWNVDTDEQGQAQLDIKASEAGQYRLSYKLTDAKNRDDRRGRLSSPCAATGSTASNSASMTWNSIADKREYAPGEKVRLLINTNRLDSTVLLFVRPVSSVYPKPQVLRLKGKSTLVEIGVAQKDMPNFFVEALTVSNGRLYTEIARDRRSAGKTRRQRGGRTVGPRLQAGGKGRREAQADRPRRQAGGRLDRAGRLRQERRIHLRRDQHSGDPRVLLEVAAAALSANRVEPRPRVVATCSNRARLP